VPDRQGILFVLHTGIGWEDLPQELGFGSGMTCWRRLKRWTDAGVFDRLHQILLARLNAANRIDWSRAVMDGSHIDAKRGCRHRSVAVNRGKPGSKHHLICDGNGTPLLVLTSGANVTSAARSTCSTCFHRWPAVLAGPDAASPHCWPTRATTAKRSAGPAASVAPNPLFRSARPAV
jgi:transposase